MPSPIGRRQKLRTALLLAPLVGVALTPLQAAPSQAAGAGYRFEQTQAHGSGQPVGWNPCRAIPVRVNLRHAPPGSLPLVMQALGDIQRASGIAIAYAGRAHRGPGLPRHYGVRIAWSTPSRDHALAGRVVGIGGSSWRQRSGGHRYFTRGAATLDGPALRHASATRRLAVLEHELGHVMGLAHVHDPTQLMYPTMHGQHGYAAGDLAGLAALGQLPCS